MNEKASVAEIKTLDEDEKLRGYSETLHNLRKDGVKKIADLKQEIFSLKKSKMIDSAEKQRLISEKKDGIEKAREEAAINKAEEIRVEKEAVAYANTISKEYIAQVVLSENESIAKHKQDFAQEVLKIKSESAEKESKLKSSGMDSATLKEEIATLKYETKSSLFDAKSRLSSAVGRCKDAKNQAFVNHVQKNRSLRNGKNKFSEDFVLNLNDYIYKFKLSKFFLDNGLYLAILVFFIVCIILAPISGNGNLLSLPNIFTILEQSSTRMFYALGVAGLILLAGTDLSGGRMVALGAVVQVLCFIRDRILLLSLEWDLGILLRFLWHSE